MDPYQFIEEDEPSSFAKMSQAASTATVMTSNVMTSVSQGQGHTVHGQGQGMMSILHTSTPSEPTPRIGLASDSVTQHEPPQQQTIQIIEQHLTTPQAEGIHFKALHLWP